MERDGLAFMIMMMVIQSMLCDDNCVKSQICINSLRNPRNLRCQQWELEGLGGGCKVVYENLRANLRAVVVLLFGKLSLDWSVLYYSLGLDVSRKRKVRSLLVEATRVCTDLQDSKRVSSHMTPQRYT